MSINQYAEAKIYQRQNQRSQMKARNVIKRGGSGDKR